MVLLLAVAAAAQNASSASSTQNAERQKPLPLKPDLPGLARNHRLILKDGSYQLVREYQIIGDRVRYYSQEREDWEELPADLVDWDATRKWERDHVNPSPDDASPAMKEAAELDKEEADARAAEKARTPLVAKGLELPDEDGVFVLDTFHGTPELVPLTPTDLDVDAKARHGLGALNPLAFGRMHLELQSAHAKVHLHVNDPAFYLSLDIPDDTDPALAHAMTVKTPASASSGDQQPGAQSPQSNFALVRLDERRAVRLMRAVHLDSAGKIRAEDNVIPTTVEALPGKRWLCIHPQQNLLIGEYALVEVLSPTQINASVWDFRVDPATGDNAGSIGPILDDSN